MINRVFTPASNLSGAAWSPLFLSSLGEPSAEKSAGDKEPPLSPARQPHGTPSVNSDDIRPLVLVVEDNRADVFLVERAVEVHELSVRLLVLDNGEEAFDYFDKTEADPTVPCPDVVLLDLNLPKRSGREVLQRVKNSTRCHHVPVIILTSSNSPEDRRETAALGALHYFRKPTSYHEFLKIGELLQEVLRDSGSPNP